jgi:uncharacterized YigZ family protein
MEMDSFLSIKDKAEGMYKEKGSKFLAYAFQVSRTDEVIEKLDAIKKKHHRARHHCYAYILNEKDIFKSYDDGEPRHTAGDPILNQIRSYQMKDILVIVVRYFGGTRLGKSGLINAYKAATKDVLSNAETIELIVEKEISIYFHYEGMNEVMRTIQQYNLKIMDQYYDTCCSITCLIPKSELHHIINILDAIKHVTKIEVLPG